MKRTILQIFICIAFYNTILAQKNTIEINFGSMTIEKNCIDNIKRGDFYQIKINGLNQNLFKVSINSIDTSLSKPQSTPTFGNFNLDALSKAIAGISSSNISITQSEDWKAFLKTISNTKSLFPDPIITVNSTIVDRMGDEKHILSKAKLSVENLAERIDNFKLEVYKHRLNSLKTTKTTNSFGFEQALIDLDSIRQDISTLKAQKTKDKNLYEAFSATNKVAIAKVKELESNDKLIKESYEKLLTSLTQALESISADKANELLSSIVFIENNADNTYTSLPIQYMGEQTKVQIAITPRDEKYNLQNYSTQIVFPDKIKSYVVVGVSFYGSSLYDKSYSTIKSALSDSTYSYSFKEENIGEAELGIAALLRYGTKVNDANNFGVHGSFGAGVQLSNKIKPRMLLGGGFTIGDKHMLAFDFGGIAGYVDRLSSTVDLTQSYGENPESIVISKLDVGLFLSFGYTYQF